MCHLLVFIHHLATQLEKEKEAEAKYEALKLQVQLVRDFAVQLSHLHVSCIYKEIHRIIFIGHSLNMISYLLMVD